MEMDEEEPTSSSAVPPVSSKRGNSNSPAADPPVWHDTNWQPQYIPFTARPGPRNAAADLQSDQPVDYLELFMTDEVLQTICVQTNLYAEQHTGAEESQRPHAWRDITVGELKNFLGLLFLTGVVRKAELGLYWSTEVALCTPWFGRTMSQDRFQTIWRFLRFSDNEPADAADGLCKIRPVLDYLLAKFREMFLPGENITIDEGLLQWSGRLTFKVYNPQKPMECGIKSYVLCDSATGYCFNMKPYFGDHSSLGDAVVFLLDDLAGHGYRLYTDSYCNSVQLCQLLLGLQTHTCGTLRKNRGEPPAFREVSGLKIGERMICHNDAVMVLAWRDKRMVRMATTFHMDETHTVLVKRRGHRERVPKEKPACVVEHVQNMYGVDRLDHDLSFYPFVRKSAKLTNKFAVYLFQICLFNAFTIYKAKNPDGSCQSLYPFIVSVVKSWTTERHAPEEASDD